MNKLLIIDSHFVHRSPSMKGLLSITDALLERFESIEVWTCETDIEASDKIKFRIAKSIKPWTIESYAFRWQIEKWANDERVWPPKDTVVLSTCFHQFDVDVRYIHFNHTAYYDEKLKRPEHLKFSLLQNLVTYLERKVESKVWNNFKTKHWWVVSRDLGEFISSRDSSKGQLHILPNSYDSSTFSNDSRLLHRDRYRSLYGFTDHDIVFTFSAYSHFERKGLKTGIQAIATCRKKGFPFKYLILGGKKSDISEIKKWAERNNINLEGIVFAGLVTEIYKHLSAADAFLFPSHFEAFSLAEIEACALGLRVYLTPHYGHEMLLESNGNGRVVSWDYLETSKILEEEFNTGNLKKPPVNVGEALNRTQYKEQLLHLLEQNIR